MDWEVIAPIDLEYWPEKRDLWIGSLNDPRARTTAAYEGREMILFLKPAPYYRCRSVDFMGVVHEVVRAAGRRRRYQSRRRGDLLGGDRRAAEQSGRSAGHAAVPDPNGCRNQNSTCSHIRPRTRPRRGCQVGVRRIVDLYDHRSGNSEIGGWSR